MNNNKLIVFLFITCLGFISCQSIGSREASMGEVRRDRTAILDSMQQAMGTLPDRSNLPAPDVQIIDRLEHSTYTRYNVRFTAAENEIVPAYLYIPRRIDRTEKRPAMVVLHPTGDQGKLLVDTKSQYYSHMPAKELAERGYVVIAPDYPSMGDLKDYDFDNDRYESGTMKAIFNHMRSVDLLQEMEEVDPERVGVIGHSLGGHNAMFLAAFDQRIKVIVSSCGWTLLDYYDIGEKAKERYGGRLGPWAQDRYMPPLRDKYNLDGATIPFDFDDVIAALAPRPFFSNSPLNDSNFDVEGVKKAMETASALYRSMGAEENLQVRYPEAGHDFPPDVRLEAYEFIDQALQHTPEKKEIDEVR